MVSSVFFSNKRFFLKGKKGFGGVISSLIMFIAIIIVTTSFIMLFNERVSKTETSLRLKNDLLLNKLRTDVTIVDVYYNSTTQEVKFYLKDIGKTELYTKRLDIFLDGVYVRSFNVYNPADLTNLTLLQPYGLALINFTQNLPSGTHKLLVNTEYGTTTDYLFNT